MHNRREMLQHAAGGFGAIALAGMLNEQASGGDRMESDANAVDPLAPHQPHFPATADRVIFIYSTGGTSHVDSFDYKPQLFAQHGKTISVDNWQGKLGEFTRYLKKPNWKFRPGGMCGTMVSDLFPHLRSVADDLCIIRSIKGDHTGHDKASMGMHTGSFNFARPSIGAWVSYGLGTVNQNLPSFMVLAANPPYAGAQTWGSDFLPGCHQGTQVIPGATPIANITRRTPSEKLQRMELELLQNLNQKHLQLSGADLALEAQIKSFETAFGMQHAAPEAFDLSDETPESLALYGMSAGDSTSFGWHCLMARRLVERGVRFVELIDTGSSNNWDSHGDMNAHEPLARNIDQPIAALLTDLKRRGLLDSTLVVWTTEFGRTPYNTSADALGREHHHQVFSSWLAGGGVKAGITYGESDEFGIDVGMDQVHVHDFHATILHLMGLDHEQLTYRFSGRDFRLTDVSGQVVDPILS